MCDYNCTINLPSQPIVIEAIDRVIDALSLGDSNQPSIPAKISINGIDIFVKSDSNPEQLALGYEFEKQKRRVESVLPTIGPIGPDVSDARLSVYISGIIYYSAEKNNSDDYLSLAKEYENTINRLAIYG